MIKQCIICSGPFEVTSRHLNIKKACSPICSKELAKERDRRNGQKKQERKRLGITTKNCVVCGKVFKPSRTVKTCSEPCRHEAARMRMNGWHAANKNRTRDINNAHQRRRYANRAPKKREYANEWYKANREEILRQIRERHKANPERRRKIWRRQAKVHLEAMKVRNRNRHARKKAAPGSHTAEDVAAILKAQNYRCAYCRVKLRPKGRHTHIDHIKPLARGGSNYKQNLQALCQHCNASKNSKDPIEYAQMIGLLL